MKNIKKDLIKLKDVHKHYILNKQKIPALHDVNFKIDEGELVVIIGPSGAGKTTLLNILGGMDTISSGFIEVDSKNIESYNDKELTLYRRTDVGFVFQFYNLMPNLTALENIELATEISKDSYDSFEILKKVGLETKGKNFPSQLSGGEQQRVSIARAIAKNPKLLLCDEPTGALDYETGKNILGLLSDIARKENKTVIIVTHNSALKDFADKVIYIKNGTVDKIITNENPLDIKDIEW